MRTFQIPKGSSISGIKITEITVNPPAVHLPLFIDVMKASASSVGNTGPDGPVVITKPADTTQQTIDIPGGFSSDFGCPSTWRVRVQTPTTPSGVLVSGKIEFDAYEPPRGLIIDDHFSLNPGESVERVCKQMPGRPGVIDLQGRITMMFDWDTDLFDLAHFNTFGPCKAELFKPDGTLAADDEGRAKHFSGAESSKLRLRYTATWADIALPGSWKIRITNNHTARIVDFRQAGSLFTGIC